MKDIQIDSKRVIRKIFVGRLRPELSDDEIRSYFCNYGTVTDIQIPFNKLTKLRKGFCCVTFDRASVAADLLMTPEVNFGAHQVDLKRGQMMMGGWGSHGCRRGYDYGGGHTYDSGYGLYRGDDGNSKDFFSAVSNICVHGVKVALSTAGFFFRSIPRRLYW